MEKKDVYFMRMALLQAQKAQGQNGWRPDVGCVIVKNGKIIANGHTRLNGRIHAEVAALKKAGKQAKSATLYSTLEPCHHNSQGIPCDQWILKNGIRKVVFGAKDPAPKNREGSAKWLAKNGVNVTPRILESECQQQHRVFLANIQKKTGLIRQPHV